MQDDIIKNDIPIRLRDTHLGNTKNNTSLFFLICIILRIILGIAIYYNKIPNYIIYLMFGLLIFIFSFKYLSYDKTWKNYLRAVISYSLIIFITKNNNNNNNIAGLVLIFDTLLAQQARFIQGNFNS